MAMVPKQQRKKNKNKMKTAKSPRTLRKQSKSARQSDEDFLSSSNSRGTPMKSVKIQCTSTTTMTTISGPEGRVEQNTNSNKTMQTYNLETSQKIKRSICMSHNMGQSKRTCITVACRTTNKCSRFLCLLAQNMLGKQRHTHSGAHIRNAKRWK